MADIANQLEGAVEGLDRFLEALDNSSMKLGSNAAVESKLARAAHKKAQQDLRFRKKIEKMEKETSKREAQHLAQLKAMQPLRQKLFAGLKQELKAKSDLIKQTKGLGDALKKTGAGLGGMFKALGSGISKAMSGLGAGFKGGIASGLQGVLGKLGQIEIAGFSVGKAIGAAAAAAKVLYEVLTTHEKLLTDITKQTGLMGDTFKDKYKKEVMDTYAELGKYGYTIKETVKLTQDMREAFGDVSYVTQDMVKTSAQLQMSYRISADNANELVEAMARSGYEGDKFLKTIEKTAITMGADVGMAMRDVAKNTQMMELYAGRGEEYFGRMATRAAMLGTDMQSIEDSGKAFEDFDQMSENFGKMGQLFGTGFNDGLKAMTDIRMMYERGNMLGIQEHITEQVAKTLYYEDGILKSMKTKDVLYQSQIKTLAATMGMDNVSALRAIKAAEMQEMMNTKNFKIEEKMLKTKESKEIFAASEYDYSMAMFSALRDADMKEEDILKKLSEEGKTTEQIIADRKELVSIAEDEMIRRAQIVKDQKGLEQKTMETMGELQKVTNALNTTMMSMITKGGEGIDAAAGELFTKISTIAQDTTNGLTQGVVDWNKDKSTFDNIKDVLSKGGKAGIAAAFDNITPEMLKGKGIFEAIEMAMVDAVGGKTGEEGIFSAISAQMFKGVDYLGELLTDSWRWLEDIFHGLIRDLSIEIDSMSIIGSGGDNAAQIQREFLAAQAQRGRERDLDDAAAALDKQLQTNATGWAGGAHRGIVGEAGTEVGITRSALRELSSAGIPGYANGYESLYTEKGTAMSNRYGLAGDTGSVRGKDVRATATQDAVGRYQRSQQEFLENLWDLQRQNANEQRDTSEHSHNIALQRQKEFFVAYPALFDQVFGEPFRAGGEIPTALYNSAFAGMQAYSRAELAGATKEKAREALAQHWTAEGLKPGGIIDKGLGKLNEIQTKQIYAINDGVEIERAARLDIFKQRSAFVYENHQEQKAIQKEISEASGRRDVEQVKVLKEQLKQLKEDKIIQVKILDEAHDAKSKVVNELQTIRDNGIGQARAQISLLGGIKSGLAAYAGVVAAGGSRDEAKEMAKRGIIGGAVRDFTASFGGTANKEFLSTMNLMSVLLGTSPAPSRSNAGQAAGRNVDAMLDAAMARTNAAAAAAGYGGGWTPYAGPNAQGRLYTSPHLAMVGEGSQNEVIIPTDRIKKGLPINAGVARELSSIGVPGYEDGKSWFSSTFGGDSNFEKGQKAYAQDAESAGFGANPYGSLQAIRGQKTAMARGGAAYKSMGGWEGGAATMGAQFANTLIQTGDMGRAAGQAIGAGIGMAATVAISAIPGGAFVAPILGPLIGGFIGNKLGGWLGKKDKVHKPNYEKHRGRAIKSLEHHVLTKSPFMFGQPAGAGSHLKAAYSGVSGTTPSEEDYEKLISGMQTNDVLGYGFSPGLDGAAMVALLTGRVKNPNEATSLYKRFNNSFYGTPMARGGIVTRPTNAVIGEAGPEAVIPLNKYGDYSGVEQKKDNQNIITELRKQNQQMQMFIKKVGDGKTVLQVDGRTLAETVGQSMYEMNVGM